MNKTIAFCPADKGNDLNFARLEKTFHKFHPDIELRRFDNPNLQDKDFWYRAKPIIATKLFEEGFETVIALDADQIILSSLQDIIEDKEDYDAGVVLNDFTYPMQIWDIRWPYYNNGLVVLKNKAFVAHWLRLCMSNHFTNYQFREQDVLNILCSDYLNYKVKQLEKDKIYGEWAKSLWPTAYLKEGKVFIKMEDKERELCVVHFGGGNTPDKGKYRLRFTKEVSDFIDSLIK